MNRVLISVEGQTEETFITEVLQPCFESQLILQPVILKTRRVPDRPADKGGHLSYTKIRYELQGLLGDRSAAAVTTMYDFYALPHDFPGYGNLPPGNGAQKVAHLEAALADDLAHPRRFRPYLQTHEFEALLFTRPEQIVNLMGGDDSHQLRLRRVRQDFSNPEEINNGPITSPAHRIRALFPAYQKVSDGLRIAMEIGLPAIRSTCPHFESWVTWLEGLVPLP